MLAWLKKVADLKAEALEKKNKLTAEGLRLSSRMLADMKAAKESGTPELEAVLDTAATHEVLNTHQAAVVHVRCFRMALSADEGENGWRWHLSVSGHGKDEDLERALELLGVPRENGRFNAKSFKGSPVMHFLWPVEETLPLGDRGELGDSQ